MAVLTSQVEARRSGVGSGGDLRRVIGFWGGTALIVGITIGSGIFRKPPTIAGLVPNPLVIMALWVGLRADQHLRRADAGGAELAAAARRRRLRLPPRGLWRRAAFVFGWLYVLVTTPATVGALAMVFAEFFLNLPACRPEGFKLQAIAIGAIVTLTVANVLGAQIGAAVGTVLTLIKVGALLAIILGVFLLGTAASRISPAGRCRARAWRGRWPR